MKLVCAMLILASLVSTNLSNHYSKKGNNNFVVKRLYSTDLTHNYYCYEFNDGGYEIVDSQTKITIEFSHESDSPYKNISGNLLTYDGPMNYGAINQEVNTISCDNIIDPVNESNTNLILSTYNTNYDTYIDNYEILKNLSNFKRNSGNDEFNKDGTCGYLAAAMILYYSKYQFNYNFIDDKYIEYKNNERRFSEDFHDYLVQIGYELGKKETTTAFDIKDLMSEYCNKIGIEANHYAMLLSTVANINMCINDNKPIALFGNFVTPSDGNKVNHAVTCYGTRDEPLGSGKTNRYFIVNFGWNNYSKVYLLDNIFRNPVGSMYNMNY